MKAFFKMTKVFQFQSNILELHETSFFINFIYNQILYIIDDENYNMNLYDFRTKFNNYENENYKISEYLKTFSRKMNIVLKNKFYLINPIQLKRRGIVRKKSNNNNNHNHYYRRNPPLHNKKEDKVPLQNIIDKYFI